MTTFTGTEFADTLLGGFGDDTINGQAGSGTVYGSGNDTLQGYYDSATLSGGDGDDNVNASHSRSAALSGDVGNDSLSVFHNISQSDDGNVIKDKAFVLDGGANDDSLSVRSYPRQPRRAGACRLHAGVSGVVSFTLGS